MGHDERIEAERIFHDRRFTDDSARAPTEKFYELTTAPLEQFEQSVCASEPGATILEYGSGIGNSLAWTLVEQGCEFRGIDISPVAVDKANTSAREAGYDSSQLTYEVMDAEDMSFPDQTFDLVFGSGILHHLDLDRAIPEIARVLKPNGYAVFFEPMGHNPVINLYRRLTPKMRTPDEHPLRMSDLTDFHRSFRVSDPTFAALTVFAALPLRKSRRFDAAVARLSALDTWLFDKLPALRRFGWIVVVDLQQPRVPSGSR